MGKMETSERLQQMDKVQLHWMANRACTMLGKLEEVVIGSVGMPYLEPNRKGLSRSSKFCSAGESFPFRAVESNHASILLLSTRTESLFTAGTWKLLNQFTLDSKWWCSLDCQIAKGYD